MADADTDPTARVDNLRLVIASFVRTREELIKRRRSATDSMMVVIDDRLATNARTLETLKRSLELAEEELRRRKS